MKAGFTLVEVMVAVAVASLLIVGVTASTQATIRTAERQRFEARAEEQRARSLELLRGDWLGRIRLLRPSRTPPPETCSFVLVSTGDTVFPENNLRQGIVTYTASDHGLWRTDQASTLSLLNGPVVLKFWDGNTWRSELPPKALGLRLELSQPQETVILK